MEYVCMNCGYIHPCTMELDLGPCPFCKMEVWDSVDNHLQRMVTTQEDIGRWEDDLPF